MEHNTHIRHAPQNINYVQVKGSPISVTSFLDHKINENLCDYKHKNTRFKRFTGFSVSHVPSANTDDLG